jgi:hypothetical protein
MKRKERYIARLDEVKITREGDYAFIEYKEEGVPATRLQIGPESVFIIKRLMPERGD